MSRPTLEALVSHIGPLVGVSLFTLDDHLLYGYWARKDARWDAELSASRYGDVAQAVFAARAQIEGSEHFDQLTIESEESLVIVRPLSDAIAAVFLFAAGTPIGLGRFHIQRVITAMREMVANVAAVGPPRSRRSTQVPPAFQPSETAPPRSSIPPPPPPAGAVAPSPTLSLDDTVVAPIETADYRQRMHGTRGSTPPPPPDEVPPATGTEPGGTEPPPPPDTSDYGTANTYTEPPPRADGAQATGGRTGTEPPPPPAPAAEPAWVGDSTIPRAPAVPTDVGTEPPTVGPHSAEPPTVEPATGRRDAKPANGVTRASADDPHMATTRRDREGRKRAGTMPSGVFGIDRDQLEAALRESGDASSGDEPSGEEEGIVDELTMDSVAAAPPAGARPVTRTQPSGQPPMSGESAHSGASEVSETVLDDAAAVAASFDAAPRGPRGLQMLAHLQQHAPDAHVVLLRVSLQTGLSVESLRAPEQLSDDQLAQVDAAAQRILGFDRMGGP